MGSELETRIEAFRLACLAVDDSEREFSAAHETLRAKERQRSHMYNTKRLALKELTDLIVAREKP